MRLASMSRSGRTTCHGEHAADRPAVRAGRTARAARPRRVRRASAGLSRVRAGAALVALATAAAIYGVASSSAFEYANLRVLGARYTDVAAVEAALAEIRGDNLFRIDTRPFETKLGELPTVARASVKRRAARHARGHPRRARADPRLEGRRAALPRRRGRHAVRRAGRPAAARRGGSPVVEDRRAASAGLAVGQTLDPIDLDAATRLGSLRPSRRRQRGRGAGRQPDRRERLRRPHATGRLDGGLRVLHAQPADPRAHPWPGPVAAQPARRTGSGGRAGHPRRPIPTGRSSRGRRPTPTPHPRRARPP